MKTTFFFLLLFLGTQAYAQTLNQKSFDEKKQRDILIGYCNRDGFATCSFDSAYQANYTSYVPDSETMRMLRSMLVNVKIKIIMGTWCGDSEDQVPRFYKIIDLLSIEDNKLTMICVDRSKTAPGIDISGLNITLVPTFIFYRNDKEIGRITETPMVSLEKDMLKIVGTID